MNVSGWVVLAVPMLVLSSYLTHRGCTMGCGGLGGLRLNSSV